MISSCLHISRFHTEFNSKGDDISNDAKFSTYSDILVFLLDRKKKMFVLLQTFIRLHLYDKEVRQAQLFLVLFEVDSNFSIITINIILLYRRHRLSENDSPSSVVKLVGN